MSEMGSRPAEELPSPVPRDAPRLVEVTAGELERRAVQVGTIAGRAVAIFRRVRRQWYQFDTKQAVGDAAETVRREAEARSREWRKAAEVRSAQLRDRARAGYERTRVRAEEMGRDYPAQVVLVAAAVGFVLGAGLRVWRSSRAA